MLASLGAALMLAAATPAAADQCVETYGERICATAGLTSLRTEMEGKLAAVLAAGNRTATWQARHDIALARLKAGLDYGGERMSDAALAQAFRDHIADLDKALAQAGGIPINTRIASARSATCMAKWLDQGCRVAASGMLRAKAGGTVLWQMMEGASGQDGTGAGIILWASRGAGPAAARLIGFSFDGVTYEPPRLTQDGMIWVPGRVMGTGSFNADLLFRWDDTAGAWQDIELERWWGALPGRLPRGFGVWKGVDYDFNGMAAATGLWRDQDANCCPTGGKALLEFEIAGRSLVLKQVRADIVEKWAPRAAD